ncbi:hypothetical protein M5W76_10885 [Paenibacillus larvae]|uniref:hypothetical protein n=1 Tax=Paenibacillus larvae TaxID=1464 RepID=UPI0022817004|nr:hypothetical protein [Paenibacillus larvae]MCY9719001.1 hypothetical protein [Paenibacillus larvae]
MSKRWEKDANKGSCPTMVKEILEPSIQSRIYQLRDEYEKNSVSVLKFEKSFKELMKYIPENEVKNYLYLEDLFHSKSELIEFAYRAAVDDILMIL